MYYVYKTTNVVNNKIYVGVHKSDSIQCDQYLGSGKYLNSAVIKYGKDKFKRQILYQFESKEEAYLMQSQIVDKQFVKRKDTYNCKLGGEGGFDHLRGTVTVKDKNGNTSRVSVNDPRYLSGELKFLCCEKISVKDQNGNKLLVCKDDPKYLSGELQFLHCGKINVKDKQGIIYNVSTNDPRYISGELKFILSDCFATTGKVVVRDEQGNTFCIKNDDPRYLSGQLVGVNRGKKFPGKSCGNKNSQYGTMWITNEKQNKKVKKDNNIPEGWRRGRKFN